MNNVKRGVIIIIVYNNDGRIICSITPEPISNDIFLKSFDNVMFINNKHVDNIDEYIVADGELVKLTESEIEEVNRYGRTATEEERTLNKLLPSTEEIKKAETTIEILSLLQEVL